MQLVQRLQQHDGFEEMCSVLGVPTESDILLRKFSGFTLRAVARD